MTDQELEKLWDVFGNTPINEEDCITEKFHIFEPDTDRIDIWHWFDENHSKGVAHLIG